MADTSTNAKCTGPLELWFPQSKVIGDSNLDFWIDPDLGVCWITSKL